MSGENGAENGEPMRDVQSGEERIGACNLWIDPISWVHYPIPVCGRCVSHTASTFGVWSDSRFDGGLIRSWIYPLTGGVIYI